MKISNKLLILLYLCILAAPAFSQEYPLPDCSNPQKQPDMNYCAGQDFEKADKELNDVYKQALENQKKIAKSGGEYAGAVEALKTAQRAWIVYRDAHCENYGIQYGSGTMRPMEVDGCKETLTKARTKELHAIIDVSGW